MFEPHTVLAQLAARHQIPFDAARLPRSERLERRDAPSLHYLAWPGSGPPVVLLHGGALTAHTWDLVCLALAGHRPFALDLRGHGESDWAERYRIEDGVDDVIALVDRLELARFHLVGMSLGGNIAGHAVARLGRRVASLSLVDIAPGTSRDGTRVMRKFLAEASTHPSVAALVDAAHALSPRTDRATLAYRYHYMTRETEHGWQFRGDRRRPPDFAHMLGKLGELATRVADFPCPLLVARGTRSRVLSEEAAARFVSAAPDGRQVPIDDAGHNVQEDNPRALAAALRAHFEASWPWEGTR